MRTKKHTHGGGEKKEGVKKGKAKLSGGITSHPCRATLSREGLLDSSASQALEPRKAASSQETLVHTPGHLGKRQIDHHRKFCMSLELLVLQRRTKAQPQHHTEMSVVSG